MSYLQNNCVADIITNDYDVGVIKCSPTTVIWAAERAVGMVGRDEAKRQLAEVNAYRERYGRMPAYPDYGSLLF